MKKILPIVFFFLFFSLAFVTGKTYAAEPQPVPDPGRIKCIEDQINDPNFNSSRPYQASPCGDSPKAIMCGNSLQVIEDFPGGQAPAGTTEKIIDRPAGDKDYAADLTGTEFPIVGNTEDTKNSQSDEEAIDDATRMNEYLAWYLNGTTDRAEYDPVDSSMIVDYAGPVRKLLPSMIQDALRIASLKNNSETQTFVDTENAPSDSTTAETVTEPTNHNQIVVCASRSVLGIIGKYIPHECYEGNGSPSKGETFFLSSWKGELSIINSGYNALLSIISKIPGIGQITSSIFTEAWNKKIPPLPWADKNGNPFKTDLEYQKAYLEWRGKSCAIVPIINKLICLDTLVPNQYADLYPYIPLSNTVDKNAKNVITGVGINGLGGTTLIINDPKYYIKQEPVLYYPHTQETSDLTDSLNQTYIPKEGTDNSISYDTVEPLNNTQTKDTQGYQNCLASGNGPQECAGFLQSGGKCRLINLRSNPGDYLFPQVRPSEVRVHVNPYTVHSVPCHDTTITLDDGTEKEIAVCHGSVAIEVRMNTKVPYANEIFASTTAGANSAFRKIYPKVTDGAPVSCIADIPSVTDVTYIPKDNFDGMKVIGPLGDNTTDNAKLYFPHFGSVYDYFLKGIQTALRPKGYGEPSPISGTQCNPKPKLECTENVPDSAVPSNLLGSFKSNFIDLANRWSASCPGAENNMAEKCYNFVASEAKKAGVNPAFALTIWLNESGASNYCEGGPTTQDFGINLPDIYQNIGEQIKVFLNMAKMKLCEGIPGFSEPMHGWLSRFQSSAGVCDPSDSRATQYYQDVMTETWSWVTGCPRGGKFGITWPTDTSCP